MARGLYQQEGSTGLRLFHATSDGGAPSRFVLEGGSIEVNGRGTLLTTEECLLDPAIQVRNPGLSRKQVEATLRVNLGVSNVLWLGRGLAGDDTHGHVDDLCRFVGPRTVVLCQEDNSDDVNHRPLEENRERLEGMRLEDGSRIEAVRLPRPAPLYLDGQRLPASYANFYGKCPWWAIAGQNQPEFGVNQTLDTLSSIGAEG